MADSSQLLGKRIRSIRQGHKMSIIDLADKSGISSKHLGKVERGQSKISLECLEKVAVALGVPVKDILEADHEQSRDALNNEITALLPELSDKDTQIVYRLVKMLAGR